MVTALIHFGLNPWSPFRTICKKVSDCLLLHDDHRNENNPFHERFGRLTRRTHQFKGTQCHRPATKYAEHYKVAKNYDTGKEI